MSDGPAGASLDRLEAQIAHDLDVLAYPFKPWMPEAKRGVHDVAIVGAGQSGLSIAAGLLRERVKNVLVIDAAEKGREGPWRTFARMPTLRSPKYLTGPDLGIPSLTFRAWYEAQYGSSGWRALDKIPTGMWQDYLLWLRHVLALPVENDCKLERIVPPSGEDGFTLEVARGGRRDAIRARKIVLCTGIEGSGRWQAPGTIRDGLPPDRYAHASDPDIDFPGLAGQRVGVIGAGASAFDQAAAALEAGAREVILFTRRPTLHRVQPYKHLEKSGFLHGFAALPALWRWRFMNRILSMREPVPAETWARTSRYANFRLVVDAALRSARMDGGAIRLAVGDAHYDLDYIICGTGFAVDLSDRPELREIAAHIALWGDRFAPPPGEENPDLALYPWLGPAFEFMEKRPGDAPYLEDIHCFTFGATVSNGFSGGGMNGLRYALPRIVGGIVAGLYAADVERHYEALLAYDTPEFELGDVLPESARNPHT